MQKLYSVSASPHIHCGTNISGLMWKVIIALMPALLMGVYFFGIRALFITVYGVIGAVGMEAMILFFRRKPIVVYDGSAIITGMLVGFNVNTSVPWWIPVVGAAFAIGIGKHAFGGLGHNIVNPALLGRVFLMASWPTYMTGNWQKTSMQSINGINKLVLSNLPDQISSATPLGVLHTLRDPSFLEQHSNIVGNILHHLTAQSTLWNLFFGNTGGVIGEVSAIALLFGGLYLLVSKVIEWRITFFYLITVFCITFLGGGARFGVSSSLNIALFHLLSGGLFLGAFYMATDYVTSPLSKKGRIIFGIGCGILTVVIRLYGGYPEGVSYAILIMNLCVPIIDRFTFPKPFGEAKK